MFERQHLMSIFIEGLLTVCEGQALDKEFETQTSISISDYLHMIDLKTGHMIGLAAEIGTVSACVDEETRSSIRDYGRLLGRAFQIQDDYLEIFSDSNKMGKSLQSDIILGKKTYLMIQALEKNGRLINKLVDYNMKAGYHSIVWDSESHSSGLYFAKMIAGDFIQTQKLMLVK